MGNSTNLPGLSFNKGSSAKCPAISSRLCCDMTILLPISPNESRFVNRAFVGDGGIKTDREGVLEGVESE